ncbi:PAS domain S-box protein [Shumkonia mesophila]|uniref:PAS domain S-box protein n=1 Tax=Shumkonia mesophila TaxID=2838854 RepID=UPI002934C898|nr:PAS domain S-box protein [Shumkonia mesophila]
MKISIRIVGLVVAGFLVTASVTGVAILATSRVADRLTGVTREELPLLGVLTSITVNQLEQAVSFEKAMRLAETGTADAGASVADFSAQTHRFAVLGTRLEDQLRVAVLMTQTTLRQSAEPALQDEFRGLLVALHGIQLTQNRYGSAAQRIFFLLETANRAEAARLLPSIAIEQKNLSSEVERLVHQVENAATASAAAALAQAHTNILIMIGVGTFGLVVCVFLGLALGRSITRPINQVVVALAELVRGNVDIPVDRGRIPGEIGAIAVALGAFRDEIVSRRKTVVALAESERRFHSLAQVSPVGIFYTDPMGNCRYSNDKCAEITGLSETGMLGTGWQDALHPEDRHRVLATWEACAAEGKAFAIEYRFLKASGHATWVIGQTTSHRDGEGRVTGFVSTLTDVTEQKTAEQTLRHYARSRGQLQDITVDQSLAFDEKIRRLLVLGAETFNLPIGIVSHVEGDSYFVEHIVGPEGAPPAGAIFSLGQTYCAHTLAANSPTGFDRAGESHIRDHPCYQAFRLESYIGVPIMVDGRRYGTLNFSGPEPRERPFGESDFSLIQLFAQWIGAEISRRHARNALRISEERLKLALEGTEDGLWDWNVITGDVYFSPRLEAMLGFAPGALEPRRNFWVSRVHPEDKAAVEAALNAHLQGRTPVYEAEHRLLTKDGAWLWVLDRGKVVERRADGTPIRAVGTHTDITARKRAEDALRDSEERIRAVVDTMVDGIITIDETGIIESVNPAVERIFGFSKHELIGRNVAVLMPESPEGAHANAIQNYVRTGVAKVIGSGREFSGRRQDGAIIPLEIGISEINQGGRRMFTGIVRDITERKQIERMKNEFVSTVSHELRTPLTSIRGALGLVVGGAVGPLPGKVGELIDIAYKNSQRLIALVNDILDLEKIESGSIGFRLQPADLGQLIDTAIEANVSFAGEYGVEYVVRQPVPATTVNVDGGRILQVMTNLLSNAAKFSPAGGTVDVAVSRREGWVRVAVIDRGPGIPENFRDRIFQRFSQADSSDTRKAGGTGLGLSITKTIVERHGGHIGFDATPGGGSTFHFDLPVSATGAAASPAAPPEAEDPGALSGRKRVLVCEDDPDVAKILAMILVQGGMSAEIAYTAEAAQALLAERPFDAMTVDIMLPGKDGIALIRDVRRNPAVRDMPIVVVSARAGDAREHIEAATLGVLDWLSKPIDEERLLRAVMKAASAAPQRKARLLYVEDDDDLVETISDLLEDRVALTVASSVAEARNCLDRETFDLAILDVKLPDGSGIELLPLLKGEGQETMPVIIFSGYAIDDDVARQVDAALVKARVTNRDLLETIRRLVGNDAFPRDPERTVA